MTSPAPVPTQPPARLPLKILFLIVVIDLLGFGIVLPLLPRYAERLHASGAVIGALFSCFSAMQFIFAPLWGRLSDRIGRRPVLLVALAGNVVFYGLMGVAALNESLLLLFVSRIGAGICGATIPVAQASIADATGVEGRAKGMALIGAAFGIGFTIGPILGSLCQPLQEMLHWSYPLNPLPGVLASMLSGFALLVCLFKLPESHHPGERSAGVHRGWINLPALKRAFATPSLGALLFLVFISVFAFAQFETTLSLLGEKVFQKDDAHMLYLFTYIGVTLSVVQGAIVRTLVTRVGERMMTITGTLLLGVGIYGVSLCADLKSFWGLIAVLPVVVSGFAFITPSTTALISRRSDPERQGEILGLSQSASSLARILGPYLGNILFERHPALTYQVASVLLIPAFFLALFGLQGGKDFTNE